MPMRVREMAGWIRKEILENRDNGTTDVPQLDSQREKEKILGTGESRARVSYWWFTCMVYEQIIAPLRYALPVS